MIRILCAALAACFAMPALADDDPPKPCPTLSDTATVADALLDQGYTRRILVGGTAQAFLDYVNTVGEPTHLKADFVKIYTRPDRPALIFVADGACGGLGTEITLNLDEERKAIAAALGAEMI